jgi:hypothetical protein
VEVINMNHRTRALAGVLAALGFALGSGNAWAQNVLVNPNFDEDLAGWGLEPAASPAWDPLDVDNSELSGSARLRMVGDQRCCTQGILQYVAVVPGAAYYLGASIQVGGDSGVGGTARIFGFWYRELGDTCSDLIGSFGMSSVAEGEAGQWVFREELISAPLDARCALVKGVISKSEPTGEFVAYFDDFFLVPDPDPIPVPLLSPLAIALLGSLMGLVGWRRLRA